MIFPDGKTAAVITSWDDGTLTDRLMANFLEKYGFKGTFYVCPEHIGRETHHDLPGKPGHLDENGLRALLEAGHEIGSHSVNHPFLGPLTPEELRFQMTDSRARLESLFGVPVRSFAYPYGLPEGRPDIVEAARAAGYTSARVTGEVILTADSLRSGDLMRLPTTAYCTEDFLSIQEKWDAVEAQEGAIFHLWGHSVDLGEDKNDWVDFECILGFIGGISHVWYATVGELVAYLSSSSE